MSKKQTRSKFIVGQKVFVKPGLKDADFPDLPIGGWSGTIMTMHTKKKNCVIKLDARTLDSIDPVYKKRCERDGLEFSEYCLGETDLELLSGDPPPIEQPTNIVSTPLDDEDQDDRLRAVFALTHDDPLPAVDELTQAKYHTYLKAHLQLPCEVTGTEDFRWEERYVIGGWSPKEYEKLKKTQPSYTDRYQLLDIDQEGYSEWMMCGGEDIVAYVQRTSDGKEFALGLSELKATDKKSLNFQLIKDYAVFFWNNR